MRGGYIFSGTLHAIIIAVVIFGLPGWWDPPLPEHAIPVELVALEEIEEESPPEPEPEPEPKVEEPDPETEPEPEIEPKRQTAALPQPSETVPRQEPEPQPEPEPEPEALQEPVPEPEPEPEALHEPVPEPEPEPEPEVAEEPEPEPKTPPPAPRRKPEKKVAKVEEPEKKEPEKEEPEPDMLASILKNVEKLKEEPQPQKQQEAKAQTQGEQAQTSVLEQMELARLIRSQLEACWRLEPGARQAEDLVVKVRVLLNQDGSVREAQVEDVSRMVGDAYYRSAAENALRAIHKCSPFSGLPLRRYAVWRDITLNFNPSEMF